MIQPHVHWRPLYSDEKHDEKFMRTVGRYMDLVSNNYYNYWTPDSAHMADWTAWTGKPFIITEYYTKEKIQNAKPKRSRLDRPHSTRQGLFYQNYNLALIESKIAWDGIILNTRTTIRLPKASINPILMPTRVS